MDSLKLTGKKIGNQKYVVLSILSSTMYALDGVKVLFSLNKRFRNFI
jgi:hypothetical protein